MALTRLGLLLLVAGLVAVASAVFLLAGVGVAVLVAGVELVAAGLVVLYVEARP